jgi:hypothetical protein
MNMLRTPQILPLLLPPLASLTLGCVTKSSLAFDTPEDAVHYLMVSAEDPEAAEQLLGPGGFDLLRSGDEVADRQDFEAVVELMREKLAFEDLGDGRKLALLGDDAWELPIPLASDEHGWHFDVEAGREEILNRRVGRNELSTIETLRAVVEAQREYAAAPRDGIPPAFAQRLLSSPGRHDGLYWPATEGQEESPLGPFVAEAAEEGYKGAGQGKLIPYHGYFYRLLTAQGASAPGGARNYLDKQGRLTGGFAVVAWPATHGNSGVMTFLVNQQGIVFQRDLGPQTAEAAARIQSYDPDEGWMPSVD